MISPVDVTEITPSQPFFSQHKRCSTQSCKHPILKEAFCELKVNKFEFEINRNC